MNTEVASNEIVLIIPPAPPGEEQFVPGEFKYVTKHQQIMLSTAYKAITITENWNFVKKDILSFAFSNDVEIQQISNEISKLGYDGHSGSSFGYTMRCMQFIALNGEREFMKNYMS